MRQLWLALLGAVGGALGAVWAAAKHRYGPRRGDK